MEKARLVFYLLMCLLWCVGCIGAAVLTWHGEYPFAIGVIALGYMAFPKAKEYFYKFNDN